MKLIFVLRNVLDLAIHYQGTNPIKS
jgi:hypothetical protein